LWINIPLTRVPLMSCGHIFCNFIFQAHCVPTNTSMFSWMYILTCFSNAMLQHLLGTCSLQQPILLFNAPSIVFYNSANIKILNVHIHLNAFILKMDLGYTVTIPCISNYKSVVVSYPYSLDQLYISYYPPLTTLPSMHVTLLH